MINKIHSRHLPSLSLSLPSSLPDSSFSLTLWQEGRELQLSNVEMVC